MNFKYEKKDILMLLPVVLIFALFLFLFRARVYETHLTSFFWNVLDEYAVNLDSYLRMEAFVLISVVSLVVLVFGILTSDLKMVKHKVYIPMVVFVVFVLLSYMFSEYKAVAAQGFSKQFESTFVLVGYMIITLYAMNVVNKEWDVKLIVNTFAVACFLAGIWGISEKLGNVIQNLPSWIYTPVALKDMVEMGDIKSNIGNIWFFGNQNFLSFFLVIPVSIFSMVAIGAEDIKKKLIFSALVGLMFFNLFAAESSSGYLSIFCAVVFGMVVFGGKNLAKWGKSIGILLVCVIIAAIPNIGSIKKEFNIGSTVAFAAEGEGQVESEIINRSFIKIDYIKTVDKTIEFLFQDGMNIFIDADETGVTRVYDKDGNDLPFQNQHVGVRSEFNQDFEVMYIYVQVARYTWRFAYYNDRVYYASPSGMGILLDDSVETFGFEGNESFGTNRGYIWSRTIPILKETILIGKGAGTYSIYFPQDDYVGLYNVGFWTDSNRTKVDKPHNMYLGTAVNTGVVSLVALLTVFGMFVVEGFLTYRKREFKTYKEFVGAGAMLAIVGILVGGLVNDSLIQVMPFVYATMGMGFAINRLVKKDDKESL